MDHWEQRDKDDGGRARRRSVGHPQRDRSNSPWLEWRFRFTDVAGRRRCTTLGQWPSISESEAREMAKSLLVEGDARTVGRIMLRYGRLQLLESQTICAMGESKLEAAIQREKEWVRYTARAQHWPQREKAEARRTLNRLESLLGRVRAFARARGIQLQPAASEARAAA
jgi:hypothetical protein